MNYIDKHEMHAALKKFKEDRIAAAEAGLPEPRVPEYIGSCLLLIAKGLAMKHNFRNYSFIDEMVSDAVYACLKYVKSYDPDRVGADGKPTSAFTYFTQTCWYSFINRISDEKKQTQLKKEMFFDADIQSFAMQEGDEEFKLNMSEYMRSLGDDFVPRKEVKRKKKVKESPTLEGFNDE